MAGPVSPLESSYSSFYFSTVLSTAIYGITLVQTFFYYVHYQQDHWHIKIFVATMWAFNTIHEALSISGVWRYIMAGLLNPFSFAGMIPDLIVQVLFSTLLALPTQGFLVYRIYIFSGRNIIAPIMWAALAIVLLVSSILFVVKALLSGNGPHTVPFLSVLDSGSSEILATIILSVAAGIDVLITMCMTILLLRERTITRFASTADVLQRLTLFAVNTGAWPALFALLGIILLHLFPKNALYMVFAIPIGPVYCNTLLANLNARAYFRDEMKRDVRMDLWSAN